ncbi:MAG TPA: choice-of-anchor J domain-containing protein [Chryseolinea sp.]|nr:choice-of-anchor J domain-containing protein [Chryseolinea sp.]
MRIIAILALLPVFIFTTETSVAQDRCGTVEYTQKLKNQNLLKENETTFENWILKNKSKTKKVGPLRTKATYQVPIVVHVIHNGEAIGIGTNISDAQIFSQLAVLNKDYQRLNADASNTPAEFLPVAGNFDVEFVLAKRNPEGLATTGIVRTQGTRTSYTINDNYELKSTSYWPAEDYLNLWVCNITDYLGYAQFPVSTLDGLANSSNNRLTDGVVIAYQAFGSSDDGAFDLEPQYNKGRTATHEIGHFFGLRHTWGDDGGTCSGTDYVDDTPNQANSTSGCPAHPSSSCSNNKMFQNYLDYTNDVCMNIFTQGQVSRMQTVIENSPRRVSLLTSPALLDPVPLANDLGIKEILTPGSSECNTTFTPAIEIRNYGSNEITSAQIEVRKDGVITETKLFPSLSLALLQSALVSFNDLTFTSGAHTVTFTILQTNGTTDGNSTNNVINQSTQIAFAQSTPFTEVFNFSPTNWTIENPDQKTTWQNTNAPDVSPSNKAMKMDFYDYEDSEGEIDLLITPVLDLSSTTVALLTFDISHARFNSTSNDGLRIVVMENCNTDLSQATEIYLKKGSALATTSNTTTDFVPTSAAQWRNEIINLNSFIGQSNIQLAFIGLNDYGNNLYLDNIGISVAAFEDIALIEIISPSPVTCENNATPKIRVKNTGTVTVTSFSIETKVNNGNPVTESISGISIPPNETLDVSTSGIVLPSAENTLTATLSSPNGVTDLNPANDTKQITILIRDVVEQIPQSQNFDSDFSDQWTMVNPSGGMNFESATTNYATSLYINAFDNSDTADEAWFVSPVYDFSSIGVREMYFDLSYKSKPGTNDRLQVLASTDCGYSYPITLFNRSGDLLSSNETSSDSWNPEGESDWQNLSIDLSALANEDQVRIAFVFTNDNGNNLYIDNINYLVITKLFIVYPNPATKDGINVILNLPEGETANLEVIDQIGKIIFSETIEDTLDQPFLLSIPGAATGIYFVRVRTSNKMHSEKVLITD